VLHIFIEREGRGKGGGEERKETRLQGLKGRLAINGDPEADVLCQEVERLEEEIPEVTEFSPVSSSRYSQSKSETRDRDIASRTVRTVGSAS
jgi:hypothetical protein